jgi:hypothetical protein
MSSLARLHLIKPTVHVSTWTSAKDDRSASSGTDQTDHQGLRGPLAGILLLLLQNNVCFPTALVSQLQLWHISCPVSVQPVGDLHFTSHRDADTKVEALSICEKSASKSSDTSVVNGLCHRGLRACWQYSSRVCPTIIGSQYRLRTRNLARYPTSLPRSLAPHFNPRQRDRRYKAWRHEVTHTWANSPENSGLCAVFGVKQRDFMGNLQVQLRCTNRRHRWRKLGAAQIR